MQRKYMSKMKLNEKIEWLNYWIQDADKDKARILLIGDSVAREYRKELNEIFEKKNMVVDLIATSATILDDRIETEILMLLKQNNYNYQAAVFHIGAHHGYWIDCENDGEFRKKYEAELNNLFDRIEEIIPTIITVGGTPEKEEDIERKLENIEIRRRNKILEKVASKRGYVYIDLYDYAIKGNFEYSDWVHFYGDADEYFAQIIAGHLGIFDMVNSNRVYNLEKFIALIREHDNQKIYIYGAGAKGKLLRDFLERCRIRIENFIVSDDHFDNSEKIERFSSINRQDIFIIVSIEERTVWKEISKKEIEFITMSKDIYDKLKTYKEMNELTNK